MHSSASTASTTSTSSSSSAPFASIPPPSSSSPCYYAVIFSSQRSISADSTVLDDGYSTVTDRMLSLASSQPGYLGIESARGSSGFGITVSYWESLESISAWKSNAEHQVAQSLGHEKFYQHFEVKIAKVERAYSMENKSTHKQTTKD